MGRYAPLRVSDTGKGMDDEVRRRIFPEAGGGSETILLVEDEDMFRGLLRQVLEGQGHKVLA